MPTTNPSNSYFVITPADTGDFAVAAKGIYIGVDGDITIVQPDGGKRLFKNAKAGSILPVAAIRVDATGTTGVAGDYVGLAE